MPLSGEECGGRKSYKVGTIELLPQSENMFVIFKDGWHTAEVAQDNPAIMWQWTKKVATLAFKNPKRDVWFYLNLDGRPDLLRGAAGRDGVGGRSGDRHVQGRPTASR